MTRIADAVRQGNAFIPFITCGDPDMETTGRIVRELARAGADVIELGIPFSDPVAEGPVIAAAHARALSHGTTADTVFAEVVELRRDVTVPFVVMTYANVVFSYGTDRFCARCAEVGIDGLILPDVPFEEKAEFAEACHRHGLDYISLIAPTSTDRISMIAREAEGFVYVVSSLGVTGMRANISTDLPSLVATIREHTDIPCAIGFGVSSPQQARAMAEYADGVIVGSALVDLIARHGREAAPAVGALASALKGALTGHEPAC